jgi:hypothetical protein
MPDSQHTRWETAGARAAAYQPQPGDIGITTISGFGGRIIRALQWANGDGFKKYAHVDVVTGYGLIVEAMPGGAQEVPDWHTDVVYLRCPEQYRAAVAEAAHSLVGTPYSFLDYGLLALHRFHIPAPHLQGFIKNGGHLICSQLADRAAELGGWHIFDDGRWNGDVTPGDLHREYLKQQLALGAL